MKRGLGKGSWRSSKEFREATRIMERLIWFSKNVRLQPINNQRGHLTSMYNHFIEEDEKTRIDRDTCSEEVAQNPVSKPREISYRFMPQVVKTEENMDLLTEFNRFA